MQEQNNHPNTGARLSAEDQQRVNAVINSGIHSVERAPFRPWLLLFVIMLVLTGLSVFSYLLARWYGVI